MGIIILGVYCQEQVEGGVYLLIFAKGMYDAGRIRQQQVAGTDYKSAPAQGFCTSTGVLYQPETINLNRFSVPLVEKKRE